MCFLDLIEQDNRIRFSTDCLRQLTAFIISDISRRRSDQTGHGIFLHILTHIKTHHIGFVIKKTGCQSLCKFCLTDTGRS